MNINTLVIIIILGLVTFFIVTKVGHEHGPDSHGHGLASESQQSQQSEPSLNSTTHDNIDSQ